MANNEYTRKNSYIFALINVSIIFDIVHHLGFFQTQHFRWKHSCHQV